MLTMFYFCVRTPLSGFWCASISCCLDFESKSKCFPAIFYAAVFNINVRHVRDINIFCSSGDVKIGQSKPIKLLIAKLPPIWSLVKAQSYERTPFRQASVLVVVSSSSKENDIARRSKDQTFHWQVIDNFPFQVLGIATAWRFASNTLLCQQEKTNKI